VREATTDDIDFIVDANIRLAEESEDKQLDAERLLAGVRRGLGSPEMCRYFVCEVDGARAGTTMVTYELTDWRDGVIWWLQSVYVHPRFRQRGVFRTLYRHIESLARGDDVTRALRLYVKLDNARAIRTYRAMGMAPSGYEVYEDDWSSEAHG